MNTTNWMLIAAIVLCFATSSFGQSGQAKSLEVGNRWTYLFTFHNYFETERRYESVIADTTIAGKVYAVIDFQRGTSRSQRFERADSNRILQFIPSDTTERLVCDFRHVTGDSLGSFRVIESDSILFWRRTRRFITYFEEISYLYSEANTYVEGIGKRRSSEAGLAIAEQISCVLLGAVLEGVVYGDTALTSVAESASQSVPSSFALHPNFPNPFNPEGHSGLAQSSFTTISFAVPQETHVILQIFSLTGELVRTLTDGNRGRGVHRLEWNGRDELGNTVASGLYLYRLQAGGAVQARRLLVVK